MSKQGIYTVQDWMDYLEGRISGNLASTMEQSLVENIDAMDEYLEALTVHQNAPTLADPAAFADNIMQRIESLPLSGSARKSRSGRNRRWIEHRVFHYALAACLTLIFLSSGLFDKVAPYHKFQDSGQGGSFTEKWTEAAVSWLDNLKPKP